MNYDPVIPKSELEDGAYYEGRCRNAEVARWNGKVFHHWRTKFGNTFIEEINAPEDNKVFDVFIAKRKMSDEEVGKFVINRGEIPLICWACEVKNAST